MTLHYFTYMLWASLLVPAIVAFVWRFVEKRKEDDENTATYFENMAQLRTENPQPSLIGEDGKLNLRYNPLAMDEDFFIPVRNTMPGK